ncbi:MAG TPA: GNAT family N-acetyltransferase [Gaiellaceae bacterium]
MPLASEAITTERLSLEPLRPEDAEEMAALLDDERLHEFVGGRPRTPGELRKHYAALVAGPAEANVRWLNWIVRRRGESRPLGTVQATLTNGDDGLTAHVAWVIGVEWQNQGFASEAARALVGWLRERGAEVILANIHPDHRASAAVARRAGLEPTDEQRDGEQVWRAPR